MRHKLIEMATGAEVKPGMNLIDFRNEMYKLVSFTVMSPPSTGRVVVTAADDPHKREHEFYPSVFGLKIVEIDDGK